MLDFIRKNLKTTFICAAFIVSCSFLNFSVYNASNFKKPVFIENNTKKLISILDKSIQIADSTINAEKLNQLQSSYFIARKYYKQIECFIEYCSPFDAKYFINGPLVKKSDLEIGTRIVDPHGFQVIEEQLFGVDSIDGSLLLIELKLLKESFKAFESKLNNVTINDSQIIEMMQFELIRMSALTLSGYDASFTKTNSEECKNVFEGFRALLHDVKLKNQEKGYPVELHQKLISRLKLAENYCVLHKDYDSFNRIFFITQHIKPIYKLLVKIHQTELFPYTQVDYAINLNNEHIFEREYYNINYFTIKTNDTLGNPLQAKLGELLFFDPVLSGNNKRACASCHKPELAFTDGFKKGISFEKDSLDRNTPTLLNTVFQKNFFYDGRARQLEQQANDVLHNQREMNSSIEQMIDKLNQSEEYQSLFKKSFKGTADTNINYYGILKAITEYEKQLVSMNSRFDKYIKGDYKQLNTQEINGYNLFSGKALCGSCHFFPLFNGLVPPIYNDTEYEVIGVPEQINSKQIDKDKGRIIVSRVHIHQHAFKTPSIRNIQLTAPYMHNGIYKTLEEVIDFYNKGGGQGLGVNIPNQTLPFDSLRLSKKEINDIKAFMLTLTDTTGITQKPKKLPRFNDDKLNHRVIGGEY
ncbi:MAG: cytochrome-c peroxidase [Bacteroidia bacterium]|nr:cytochrome-c peroxidase [Bacteroidia bacterium]